MLDKATIENLYARLENLKVKIEFYSLLLNSDKITTDKQKAQEIIDGLLDEFTNTKQKLAVAEIWLNQLTYTMTPENTITNIDQYLTEFCTCQDSEARKGSMLKICAIIATLPDDEQQVCINQVQQSIRKDFEEILLKLDKL